METLECVKEMKFFPKYIPNEYLTQLYRLNSLGLSSTINNTWTEKDSLIWTDLDFSCRAGYVQPTCVKEVNAKRA